MAPHSAEAGLAATRHDEASGVVALRDELAFQRRVAHDASEGDGRPTPPEEALRAKVLAVRRRRLLDLRRDGTIGDANLTTDAGRPTCRNVEEEADRANVVAGGERARHTLR